METHPNQQHGSEAGGFYFALLISMEECVGLPPVCEWAVSVLPCGRGECWLGCGAESKPRSTHGPPSQESYFQNSFTSIVCDLK